MGFCEFLTISFIILKLLKIINWSWVLILLPEIIAFIFYVAIIIIWLIIKFKI